MKLDKMINHLNWVDIGMVKISVLAATLLIAKYWPASTSLTWYWYVLVFVVVLIRPMKHMCTK